MKLCNPDYTINPHEEFTTTSGPNAGKRLRVIGTKSTGAAVINAVDTIKNLETGKFTELSRIRLCEMAAVVVEKQIT